MAKVPVEEKSLNVYQRINAVMKDVSYIQKEDKKVNNMYRFVSHDQVTSALNGPLCKHGIVVLPSIAELTQDGNKTVVKLSVRFVNMDDPTDQIEVFHYGYGIDPSDKGVGKAVSYAFKYAMLKTFCLETGDDPEKDDYKYEPAKEKEDPKPNYDILLNKLESDIVKSCNENEKSYVSGYLNALEKHYKKTSPNDWSEKQYVALKKLNGDVKSKALEWSLNQAT